MPIEIEDQTVPLFKAPVNAKLELLRVLLDKPPDNEISTVWGQFLFGYIINSTYPGGLPKVKSLACTVP